MLQLQLPNLHGAEQYLWGSRSCNVALFAPQILFRAVQVRQSEL